MCGSAACQVLHEKSLLSPLEREEQGSGLVYDGAEAVALIERDGLIVLGVDQYGESGVESADRRPSARSELPAAWDSGQSSDLVRGRSRNGILAADRV